MWSDIQNNEEQLELLLMTLEDMKHGICLFESKQQKKWVSAIQERLGREKIIVHNIADDKEEQGMVTSQNFRKWANQSSAQIVVVYNIQLLGMRYGDKEVVEKLNFMRDQILALGKLFVLGVSPYFHMLLSRNARDLYSCILYHYHFKDSEEPLCKMVEMEWNDLSGDDKLEMKRYEELKERIQEGAIINDVSTHVACINSWLNIGENLSFQESDFIYGVISVLEKHYKHRDVANGDIDNLCLLAQAYLRLEEYEKCEAQLRRLLDYVKETLGEEHEIYADILGQYAIYCDEVNEFNNCEVYCDKALKIYEKVGKKYFEKARDLMCKRAILYRRKRKYDMAMDIYNELLQNEMEKHGEKYFWNAYLYNNMGRIYQELGEETKALEYLKRAAEILESAGKNGGACWHVYVNISQIYILNEDVNAAWDYAKRAKRVVENVYGSDSSYMINVYNTMSCVWELRERVDKQKEYLEKAVEIIQKRERVYTESAAYVFFNIGALCCCMRNFLEAKPWLELAMDVCESILAENDLLCINCYEWLGYVYYEFRDLKEGKKYISKAADGYEKVFGRRNAYGKRMEERVAGIMEG